MGNQKQVSIVPTILIVILSLLVVGLGGYITYDKLINTNESNNKNNEETNENNDNYVATRTCVGSYSGNAAITKDAFTGKYGYGTLTIELKSNGTYNLKKENANGASGEYTIIENVLLLKTTPDICPPNSDCSASYSEYLYISEDCSRISSGYGSYFFDPNFTLNK